MQKPGATPGEDRRVIGPRGRVRNSCGNAVGLKAPPEVPHIQVDLAESDSKRQAMEKVCSKLTNARVYNRVGYVRVLPSINYNSPVEGLASLIGVWVKISRRILSLIW